MISFSKYEGAGNDFIIIASDLADPLWAPFLCDRHRGIGADGLILVHSVDSSQITISFYNCDGSQPAMCGNALRCAGLFLKEQFPTLQQGRVIFNSKETLLDLKEEEIGTCLDVTIHGSHNLRYQGLNFTTYIVDSGVPHAVIPTSNLNQTDFQELGSFVRWHPLFSPQGVNATVACQVNCNELEIRTYERGVEKETLACGTGAAAAAIAFSQIEGLTSPISVKTISGEILKIYFQQEEGLFKEIWLYGPSKKVFTGTINLPLSSTLSI